MLAICSLGRAARCLQQHNSIINSVRALDTPATPERIYWALQDCVAFNQDAASNLQARQRRNSDGITQLV